MRQAPKHDIRILTQSHGNGGDTVSFKLGIALTADTVILVEDRRRADEKLAVKGIKHGDLGRVISSWPEFERVVEEGLPRTASAVHALYHTR